MTVTNVENTPYTLEIIPPAEGNKHFSWAIRKHGKMLQRSDRGHHSEDKARSDGLGVIEKIMNKVDTW